MIWKTMIQVYYQYGFFTLIQEIFFKILRELGVKSYKINLFVLETQDFKPGTAKLNRQFYIRTYTEQSEIPNSLVTDIEKIEALPVREFLRNGAQIEVVFKKDIDDIAGYGFVQTKNHSFNWGKVALKQREQVWLGPDYVKPEYRRQGLHTNMRLYSLERLKNEGVVQIFTGIVENNKASNKTYINLGFQHYGVVKLFKTQNKKTSFTLKYSKDSLNLNL